MKHNSHTRGISRFELQNLIEELELNENKTEKDNKILDNLWYLDEVWDEEVVTVCDVDYALKGE